MVDTTLLWTKFTNESVFANYSPFIVCFASGTLKHDVFLKFISKDFHVLHAFDEALYWAEQCAEHEEEKKEMRAVQKSVKHWLKFYRAREWGLELPRHTTILRTTTTYTEFLLDVALGKIEGVKYTETPSGGTKFAAYILAAMAPWMRLYATISNKIRDERRLLVDTDEISDIYKQWVYDHCSFDFKVVAFDIEELLGKLSNSLTGEELEVIERLYLKALKLEVEFFASQPVVQQSVLPLSLLQDPADSHLFMFCDFENACSTVGTPITLRTIAVRSAEKVDTHTFDSQLTRMSSADLRRTWETLLAQHVEEQNQLLDSITKSETAAIFNYEDVRKALEQVADLVKRTNSRVIESGALKGLSLNDINGAGKCLALQVGCKEFFQKIANSEKLRSNVHVISCCLCSDLIRSALSSGDVNVRDVLNVHSKEVAYEGSVSTGEIIRMVESPVEKLQIFSNILKDCRANDKKLTVYVGGSESDLLCLLQADIGIVISATPGLMKLGKHFGISFVPLFSGVINKQRELAAGGSPVWKGLEGILYTVSCWAEIHAFILGAEAIK